MRRKNTNIEPKEVRGEKSSQLLIKPCRINRLQGNKQSVKINLLILIALFISSTDLLSSSEFCKINPPVVNLLPVKINQLPSAGRVNFFVKNWHKLTSDPMILDVVRGYEIPFPLPTREPRLSRLGRLTLDLVDQDVQDMLREGAIVVLDPR